MAESTQIAFRTLKGIGVLDAAPVYEPLKDFTRPEGTLRCYAYSPDGRFFAWASPNEVFVIQASDGKQVTVLPATNVYELGFSPLGSFMITWQRPSKDENGDAVKNLRVWRTIDEGADPDGERKAVGQFVQKSQTGWNLGYTADEQFCARVVTNEVQFYRSDDLTTVWNKLRLEGVSDFAVSPGQDHSVAVFVPERKGQPAAVKVYKVPSFDQPVSQKTFFKGDKVQLKWNQLGTSLIVLAQTDVDKSNRSYYGETNMYILSANGGFDSRIDLDKEGPIHDVTWSPSSKEFGVVYGYMPAKTTIFDQRANPVHNFSLAPRNMILFSPHGRFVIVAGFGNLAGQMDIYDLQKDYAKLVTIEASNASVCEWSPDGRHILTATTSPRLRVDNGVRIWHISGQLMYNEDMTELYEVTWRPQIPDKFPFQNGPLSPGPAPHSSAAEFLGKMKTPSKPAGAYRPPGARGTSTPLHFKREDQGGAAYVSDGPSGSSGPANSFGVRAGRREVPGAEKVETKPLPPGAVPGGGVSLTVENGEEGLSKAALKNRKKREAKKAKEAADKDGGDGDSTAKSGLLDVRSPNDKRDRSRSTGDRSRSRGGDRSRTREGTRARGTLRNGAASPSPAPGTRRLNRHQQKDQVQQNGQAPPPEGKTTKLAPPKIQVPAANGTASNGPLSAIAESIMSPGGNPQDKKRRALLKKLRAIDELKMRQAGGEQLELSQVSKIESEEKVRKELDELGDA